MCKYLHELKISMLIETRELLELNYFDKMFLCSLFGSETHFLKGLWAPKLKIVLTFSAIIFIPIVKSCQDLGPDITTTCSFTNDNMSSWRLFFSKQNLTFYQPTWRHGISICQGYLLNITVIRPVIQVLNMFCIWPVHVDQKITLCDILTIACWIICFTNIKINRHFRYFAILR